MRWNLKSSDFGFDDKSCLILLKLVVSVVNFKECSLIYSGKNQTI